MLILFSVAGALAALALQRYVIIIATAFGGAQTALVGAAALMGDPGAAQVAARTVYRVYPLDPMPNTYWDATAASCWGRSACSFGWRSRQKARSDLYLIGAH